MVVLLTHCSIFALAAWRKHEKMVQTPVQANGSGIVKDQATWSKRCRKSGSLARPNIERLINLSFWTWASTGP
jgi:hypothetical protein